jgi:glycosyltransferase involved in cell wall biosynthesis
MKKLTDIMLVKSDPIVNQSSIRAIQIIKSLRKRYSIIGLGWNRKSDQLLNKENSLQLFNLKAPYGFEPYGPIRLISYFPIFWIWVFAKLVYHRPKAVHACDLSTILPCFLYKVLFRRKLVFDILDRYGMTYIPKNRNIFLKTVYAIVNSVEENFAKNADVLITVSDKMLFSFNKKPRNSITILNCPEENLIVPSKQKSNTNRFQILFTGAIRKGRGLEAICDIISDLKDTQLVITGKIKDANLQEKISGIDNIKYKGFLDRGNLLDLESNCDVMLALYDLKLQSQYEYGMANKILEAMMCGIPVITNISHELINDTKCGIIVEYDNTAQIKNAIVTLRDDPSLRKSYGNNGRKAYLEKYNWNLMKEKLYNVYQQLLSDKSKIEKQ